MGMEAAILAQTVTYDFAQLLEGAKQVSCSGFGEEICRHLRSRQRRGG
jgi:isocitrate dehydrogenase